MAIESIETKLARLEERFAGRATADDMHFSRIETALDLLGAKIDNLSLNHSNGRLDERHAHRQGLAKGGAGVGAVAIIVTIIEKLMS